MKGMKVERMSLMKFDEAHLSLINATSILKCHINSYQTQSNTAIRFDGRSPKFAVSSYFMNDSA